MKQSLDERQISNVLYQPCHTTGQEPLVVIPFEGMFKASTSLHLSTKSVKGKSSRPMK